MEMSKKPGMRRLSILLPLLLALGLAGCAPKGLQDLSVTSARVVSIVPEGLTSPSAELEVGVHNPSARLTLTDLTGQAKYRGEALLDLSADGVVIEARTDSLYRLPVRCRLSGDVSLLGLLRTFEAPLSKDELTLSVKGRASVRGIGKDIELEDIPLGTLLDEIK